MSTRVVATASSAQFSRYSLNRATLTPSWRDNGVILDLDQYCSKDPDATKESSIDLSRDGFLFPVQSKSQESQGANPVSCKTDVIFQAQFIVHVLLHHQLACAPETYECLSQDGHSLWKHLCCASR